MQRNSESKIKREAYVVFEERGRISTWAGMSLSRRHSGRIHSCFRTSLNLEFDGRLIHLGSGQQGLCCFGICVTEARMGEILAACRVGDLAVISDEMLRIYGSGGLIFLNLREFDQVDLSVTGILADGSEWSMSRQLKCLLEAEESGLILGIEKTPEFIGCAEILTNRESDNEFSYAVSYLYGRGQGLTPSGDDILTGYWLILQTFSGTQSPAAIRAADRSRQLERVMNRLPSETTDIGRAYLDAVRAGYANEIVLCLLRKIKSVQPDAAKQHLWQLKRFGHTSGCDTIYGMYLGINYIY